MQKLSTPIEKGRKRPTPEQFIITKDNTSLLLMGLVRRVLYLHYKRLDKFFILSKDKTNFSFSLSTLFFLSKN